MTTTDNLLAAAAAAQLAALDLLEEARDGTISSMGNVASGETTKALADSLGLILRSIGASESETQLLGAVEKYLDENE